MLKVTDTSYFKPYKGIFLLVVRDVFHSALSSTMTNEQTSSGLARYLKVLVPFIRPDKTQQLFCKKFASCI